LSAYLSQNIYCDLQTKF